MHVNNAQMHSFKNRGGKYLKIATPVRFITLILFRLSVLQFNDDSSISEDTNGMVACAKRNEESHT